MEIIVYIILLSKIRFILMLYWGHVHIQNVRISSFELLSCYFSKVIFRPAFVFVLNYPICIYIFGLKVYHKLVPDSSFV